MFMFWSKRTVLTRRLLKAKVRREYETECETQEDTSTTRNNNATSVLSSSASTAATLPPPPSPPSPPSTATAPIYSHNAGGSTTAIVTATVAEASTQSTPVDSQIVTNQKQNKRSATITNTSTNNNTTTTTGNSGTSENNTKSGRGCAKLHQACCGGADSQDDRDDDYDDNTDNEINCNNIDNYNELSSDKRIARCKELLKSLKENQLDMLLTTIESYGVDLGSCVLVAKKTINTRQDNNITPNINDQQDHYRRHRHSQRNARHYHHHLRHRHTNHFNRHRSRCRYCELRHGDENEIVDESTNQIEDRRLSIGNDNTTASMRNTKCITLAPAHLLSCQMWRWPDLTHPSELKKLPLCHSAKDPSFVCCNPYHWSRLCKPESPPPPYCLIPAERGAMNREASSCAIQLSQADSRRCGNAAAPSRLPESLTTDGEDRNNSNRKEWCTLAYWELGGRVGRLYPVEASTISVFDSIHDGDGLCLASLAENHGSSAAVRRTRSKIGLGLMLSQEDDGVWAYNRSGSPIFVNSPTLDDPESRTLLVYRVPPGFCLNIFDRAKCPLSRFTYGESPSTGPVDANSVRISFAKGWGPKYSRQEITSCPCWLEVLLAPCR